MHLIQGINLNLESFFISYYITTYFLMGHKSGNNVKFLYMIMSYEDHRAKHHKCYYVSLSIACPIYVCGIPLRNTPDSKVHVAHMGPT